MAKKINIRPTVGVYATYKHISYKPWTAVAEFVDNSTQSYFFNREKLLETRHWNGLEIDIEYDGNQLIIKDNAYGMCYEDFKRAIILDSRPRFINRGEFGMGLKTAACWFGLNWSVETMELGSGTRYFAEIDVESLQRIGNEEIEVIEDNCHRKEHGTIIRIWNLNRRIVGKQISILKQQLTGIYRSDLRSGEIKIFYNGDGLYYEDPPILVEQLPDGSTYTWKKQIDYSMTFDQKEYSVKGFIALRETASTSDAGFALLRYDRVIEGGYGKNYRPEEIFEKSNSFVYQRLFGEISLDNWPVTQTKDSFDWSNGLEDELIGTLKEQCTDYIKKAKEYRKKGQETINHSFESVIDQFERQGLIQEAQIESIRDSITTQDVDQVNHPGREFAQPGSEDNDDSKMSTSNLNDARREILKFRCNGVDYQLTMKISTDDPFNSWLLITNVDHNANQYDIDWNLSHPFFQPIIEEVETVEVFKGFILAFVLSELEVERMSGAEPLPHSEIRQTMNKLLKEVTQR